MPSEVLITTGARLHFGPLSYAPQSGRHFGGAGMMIDSPGFRVTVRKSEMEEIVAGGATLSRVRCLLARYRERCSSDRQPPPVRIAIDEEIPAHAGLGSGTQLALAVAEALAILAGEGTCPPDVLAARMGRGARSAIGLNGFARGGFLVDGGKRDRESPGVIVARIDVPSEWRFVLVTPSDRPGLSGTAESDAFARLAPMPDETTERLCRVLLLDLLPAIVSADFAAASTALDEYGRRVGEYFAPVQGGIFAHPRMRELAEDLRKRGIAGVGQTSWGPTLFALMGDEDAANRLLHSLRDSDWRDCALRVARPLNTGAAVEV